jgi:DNA-binding CsgD family transcriptional regulator/PAS domain-containing protein
MNAVPHVTGSRAAQAAGTDDFAALMRLWQSQPYECRTGRSEYGQTLASHPSLALMLGLGPCVTWIVDLRTGGYEFMSANVERLLGYSPRQFTTGGIAFARGLLHPEDAGTAWQLLLQVYKCLLDLPARHRSLAGLSRDYRLRRADGTYVRLLEQSKVLQMDRRGNVTHLLGVCTDITDWKRSDVLSASVDSAHAHTCVTAADAPGTSPRGLSPREREIIRLVSEGYNSQEIADQLFISVHTVNTHRRNISGKTKTRTAGSLVRFALTNSIA